MSKQTKWTIGFKSLRGVSYTINILVDGYTGQPIPLQGSVDPITTDENNDTDFFTPLRGQTGYIRIVDTGKDLNGNDFDYTELIPANSMTHQVQLLTGSTLVFIGYIKPEMFTTELFGYNQVLSIPIQCPLGALETMPIAFRNQRVYEAENLTETFPTIGMILHTFFSQVDVNWTDVYVTKNIADFKDLNARLSMFALVDSLDPDTYNDGGYTWWRDSKSCADALTTICKFWGWTIFTRGTSIYIIAEGQGTTFNKFSFGQLEGVISSADSTEYSAFYDLADCEYVSTDHTEEYVHGYRKITVNTDVQENENVIKPALGDLTYSNPVIYSNGGNSWIEPYYARDGVHSQSGAEYLNNYYLYINNISVSQTVATVVLLLFDSWSTNGSIGSFSLKNVINIPFRSWDPSGDADWSRKDRIDGYTFLKMRTLQDVCVAFDSCISIEANTKSALNPNTQNALTASDYFLMYLRIGNKYWDPNQNSWVTRVNSNEYVPTITVYMCGDGSQIATTRNLMSPYNTAGGYCIPMPSSEYGKMEVGILMFPSQNMTLSDFRVRVVPQDDMIHPSAKAQHSIKDTANVAFEQDLTVDLEIASGKNNKWGYGQIFNQGGSYLEYVAYIDENGTQLGTKAPEKNLLQQLKKIYAKKRQRIEVEIAEDQDMAIPTSQYDHWDYETTERSFAFQAVSHNYREDKMKVTLIEVT